MESQNLIPAEEYCTYYEIEVSFIQSLHEAGLIAMTTINKRSFLHHDHLSELEKFIHLHYDLDINLEGLETIAHLLQKLKSMHLEITTLKNLLMRYEKI